MTFYYMNTDWKARQDAITCDLWFEFGMAFAGDRDRQGMYGKHVYPFRRLVPDDVVLMYHSAEDNRKHHEKGYVGIGTVIEPWNKKVYKGKDRLLYQKIG